MTHHKRKRRFKHKSLYVWHRILGLWAAVFVLILSVTGIMLNHTERLQLDHTYVEQDWLLDWYGIKADIRVVHYRVGEHTLTQAGELLYFNRKPLLKDPARLVGAVRAGPVFFIALSDKALLLTGKGKLIEKMGASTGLPTGIMAAGHDQSGRLLIKTARGTFQADKALLKWRQKALTGISWSKPARLDPRQLASYEQLSRQRVLKWQQVMLDLHSGRLFGKTGVLIMDFSAILLILLAVSGFYLWLQGKKRQRRAARKRSRI